MFARQKRGLLNPIPVLLQSIAKHRRQGPVMQDKEVRIVRRDVIIFPARVPPAKSHDRRPAPREKVAQSTLRPSRRRDFGMVNLAAKFRDDNRLVRREIR